MRRRAAAHHRGRGSGRAATSPTTWKVRPWLSVTVDAEEIGTERGHRKRHTLTTEDCSAFSSSSKPARTVVAWLSHALVAVTVGAGRVCSPVAGSTTMLPGVETVTG